MNVYHVTKSPPLLFVYCWLYVATNKRLVLPFAHTFLGQLSCAHFLLYKKSNSAWRLPLVVLKCNSKSRSYFLPIESLNPLVSFAAVIRVVTGALRDDPNNGCEGDYKPIRRNKPSLRAHYFTLGEGGWVIWFSVRIFFPETSRARNFFPNI